MKREHKTSVNYQLVDYIESFNNAYIDPEIPNWDSFKIEIEFMKTSSLYNFSLFGSSDSGSNWSGVVYFITSTRFYPAIGSTNGAVNNYINLNTRYTYSLEVDSTTKQWVNKLNNTVNTGTYTGNKPSNYHIVLFGHNQGVVSGIKELMVLGMQIYSCKITLNGTLVRDYLPAVDSNGKVGLLDNCGSICSLTGTSFYVPANSFTYGQIIS